MYQFRVKWNRVFLLLPLSAVTPCLAQPTPPRVFDDGKFYPLAALDRKYREAVAKGPYIEKSERALPSQKNLAEFELRTEKEEGYSTLYAKRQEDLAELEVMVVSSPNRDTIEGFLYNEESTMQLRRPRLMGTPSDKPLGEKVWHSYPPRDKNEKPFYYDLHVQDGPSLVRIRLYAHIDQDEKGWPKHRFLRDDDPAFVEQIARDTVWRLHTLGLTHDTFKR